MRTWYVKAILQMMYWDQKQQNRINGASDKPKIMDFTIWIL